MRVLEGVNFIMLVLAIALYAISAPYIWDFYFSEEAQLTQRFNATSPEECQNLSLQETAFCLRSYVDSIYIYNETPDSWSLTFENLTTRGGDCRDWSLFYEEITPKQFNATYARFLINDTLAHAVTFIANNEGYCLLDQTLPPYCLLEKHLNNSFLLNFTEA